MSGHYDETGAHRCECGAATKYQMMSGGTEFYCEACGFHGAYPEGEGGPRARLLTTPEGALQLRRMMYDEIARRRAAAVAPPSGEAGT